MRVVQDSRQVLFRVVILLLSGFLPTTGIADEAVTHKEVYFDIPQQRADLSLTRFAEQADQTLIFSYDNVRKETANRLVGRFPIDVAVKKLLTGTGLLPVFNDQGAVTAIVNGKAAIEGDRMNIKKKTGIAAIFAALFMGPSVNAQDSGDDVLEDTSDSSILAEVIVTAQRREQNAQDIGKSINVFDSESLNRGGILDVSRLELLTPGLSFANAATITN